MALSFFLIDRCFSCVFRFVSSSLSLLIFDNKVLKHFIKKIERRTLSHYRQAWKAFGCRYTRRATIRSLCATECVSVYQNRNWKKKNKAYNYMTFMPAWVGITADSCFACCQWQRATVGSARRFIYYIRSSAASRLIEIWAASMWNTIKSINNFSIFLSH